MINVIDPLTSDSNFSKHFEGCDNQVHLYTFDLKNKPT